jgi:hypothetical protein
MISVKLYNREVGGYLEIVNELRDMGYEQDVDFTFEYIPTRWDDYSFNVTAKKHMLFTFKDEATASWFRLKYE